MFLCISANPAIDKQIHIGEFRAGAVNRAQEVICEPGGKAAHVAMTLRALGATAKWLGFAGGSTGKDLVSGLKGLGIQVRAIPVRAATRENMAIVDRAGSVTEILEPGRPPSSRELRSFQKACEGLFARGKMNLCVILSGSLPRSVPTNFYALLIRAAHVQSCRVILDTSGEALRQGVKAGPDLVKPNRDEAEAVTGVKIHDVSSARKALKRIMSMGARSAAVSLGKDGLLWSAGAGQPVWHAKAPELKGRSAVGSGDAAVAGFAYGMVEGLEKENILKLAVCCGSANYLGKSPGHIAFSAVRKIEKTVSVKALAGS